MSTTRDSFVVEWMGRLFDFLAKISFFYWVRKLFRFNSYFFVDVWVLGWTLFAVVSYVGSIFVTNNALYCFISSLSAIRVFEIVVYQTNVLLFDPYRPGNSYSLRSYRRSVVLLLLNYLEMVFWFTTYYSMLATKGFLQVSDFAHLAVLRESIVLMVGNSTNAFILSSPLSLAVVTLHATIGLFMTIVVLARFISLLPRPATRDPTEDEPDQSST